MPKKLENILPLDFRDKKGLFIPVCSYKHHPGVIIDYIEYKHCARLRCNHLRKYRNTRNIRVNRPRYRK